MTQPAGVGFGSERITLGTPAEPTDWWSGYAAELAASGICETSRRVIEDDARHIVDRGIFGDGQPGDARWPASRVRTGAVMGAVQSGKTASMIAVTALALDAGVDAVVVLGGTRTALWLQTAERVFGQLDVLPSKTSRRYILPAASSLDRPEGPDVSSAYRLTSQQASRAVQRRRPVIAVVMKNVAHLAEMGASLREELYRAAAAEERPFHVLVIDDEADDSSVVDSDGDDILRARQVPLRIRDLWESRRQPGETAHPFLYATYVAYTATPQATFLQDPDNPLAPRDFFASLRTPGPEGDWELRQSTYRVPEGAAAWYTGGDLYYGLLAGIPVCETFGRSDDTNERLLDTVRGYLLASAIRVLRAPTRFGPSSARMHLFESSAIARSSVVGPMSMLVHPSSAKEQHFEAAASVLAWAAGVSPEEGRGLLDGGTRALPVEGVRRDIETRGAEWRRWLESYRRSAEQVVDILDVPLPAVPNDLDWDLLVGTILDEIVPGTSIAVINSDVNADDRPHFTPSRSSDGTWRAPRDLSTIFFSGNVMSRGLTLEGLTTTFFSRRADEPLADTQMQMQRWFGYRGSYIDLCRVVLTADQLELFERYHENDEALRRDVLAAMQGDLSTRPPLAVLQGAQFLATGKIARLGSVDLWPGPKPFLKHMNPPEADEHNQAVLADLFGLEAALLVPPGSGRQGVVLERTLNLLEAAELLDSLRYAHHSPGRVGPAADRWASVEHHAGLDRSDPAWPLYRPPAAVTTGMDLGSSSPYWIAAYLRLWSAALDRRIHGMQTTDDLPVPWRLVDLDAKRRQQPRFSIGLRFGDGDPLRWGPLSELEVAVYPMTRRCIGDELEAAWGARGVGAAGIRGDEFFDLRARGVDLQRLDGGPRLPGSDGQLLFHVIQRDQGRASIAVGVVLPLGGPNNTEAVRRGAQP